MKNYLTILFIFTWFGFSSGVATAQLRFEREYIFNDFIATCGQVNVTENGVDAFGSSNTDSGSYFIGFRFAPDLRSVIHSHWERCEFVTPLMNSVQSADGGYIIVGENFYFKCNQNFEIVWYHRYRTQNWNATVDVVRVDDGYVIVGFRGNGPIDHRVMTMKINEDGDRIWEKTYGVEGRSYDGTAIAVNPHGGLLITAESTIGSDEYDPWLLSLTIDGDSLRMLSSEVRGLMIPYNNFVEVFKWLNCWRLDYNGNLLRYTQISNPENQRWTSDQKVIRSRGGGGVIFGYSYLRQQDQQPKPFLLRFNDQFQQVGYLTRNYVAPYGIARDVSQSETGCYYVGGVLGGYFWVAKTNADPNFIVPPSDKQPTGYYIQPPYPNPFNGQLNLPFYLPQDGQVTARLFDSSGRLCVSEADHFGHGRQVLAFNCNTLSAGKYLIFLESPSGVATSTATLLK